MNGIEAVEKIKKDICILGIRIPGIFAWIVRPALWGQVFRGWIIMNFSTSINSLLGLLLRAIGIYFGYTQSVIF